jgi:transcriptional regulator with XRE-family HTH domain
MSQALKKLRERTGLTQVEFGHKLGKSYVTIQQWEAGRKISPGSLERILDFARAEQLDDIVDDLLLEQGAPARLEAPTKSVPENASDLPRTSGERQWVAKLLRILRSGHRVATDAVTKNLIAFEGLVEIDADRPARTGARKKVGAK